MKSSESVGEVIEFASELNFNFQRKTKVKILAAYRDGGKSGRKLEHKLKF